MERIAFFRVLRISGFRNLWLSQAISQIFLNLLMFSLIIRVYEIARNNTAVSLMIITTVLPNILIGALAGVFVDRWRRKVVMFLAHFLRIFVVLAFLLSSESLLWLYLMTILIGTITQFFMPAEGATIPEVVKDPQLLLTANSLFTLTFFTSVILGNVLAGPFLQLFGDKVTYAVVAVAFLVAAVFTSQLPGEGIMKTMENKWDRLFMPETWRFLRSGPKEGLLQNFLEGLDHIHKTPKVRQAIFIMAVGQGMIAILGSIAPGFADKVLHIPIPQVSLYVMAPAALGMILGAVVAGQFFGKIPRENIIRVAFLSAAVILVVFSEVDMISRIFQLALIPFSALVILFLGVSNAFLEVPINTLIQENTPLSVRSRVYGVISTVVGTAAVVPVLLAGALADQFGVRAVMFLAAVILLIMAIIHHKNGRNHVADSV